jgi:hypothetical protein
MQSGTSRITSGRSSSGRGSPACHAHSENESRHQEDWAKSMRSAVHWYDELSRVRSSR